VPFAAKYTSDYESPVTSICLKILGIVHIVEIYLVKDTSRIGCPQFRNQKIGQIAFKGTAHSDQSKSSRKVDVTFKQEFSTYTKPFLKIISSTVLILYLQLLVYTKKTFSIMLKVIQM
jgi:hypothetical protein